MRSFAQGHTVTKLGLEPCLSLKRVLLTQAIYSLSRRTAVVLFEACCPYVPGTKPTIHPSPSLVLCPLSLPWPFPSIFLIPFWLQEPPLSSSSPTQKPAPNKAVFPTPLHLFNLPLLSSPLPMDPESCPPQSALSICPPRSTRQIILKQSLYVFPSTVFRKNKIVTFGALSIFPCRLWPHCFLPPGPPCLRGCAL